MKQCSAFSMLELSIVLVVLGLVVGGVMTGQDLIHAARLRKVHQEVDAIKTAVHLFKGKYYALPGDMSNATRFWGDHAMCADATIDDGSPGTCNGNGNGQIFSFSRTIGGTSEGFMFWNQLAYAGMIDGMYTGHAAPVSTNDTRPDINVMGSDYSGLCYHADHSNSGDAWRFDIDYGINQLELGATRDGDDCDAGGIRPDDAWQLDKKMDDGEPAKGTIIGKMWNNLCSEAVNGAHANDNLNARYRVNDASTHCSLIFRHMW